MACAVRLQVSPDSRLHLANRNRLSPRFGQLPENLIYLHFPGRTLQEGFTIFCKYKIDLTSLVELKSISNGFGNCDCPLHPTVAITILVSSY